MKRIMRTDVMASNEEEDEVEGRKANAAKGRKGRSNEGGRRGI